MTDFDLTKEQQKELDDWFFENPYATHAAWLSMIDKIKNKYVEKNDDGFYDSLKNKVFCSKNGTNVTYYIFGEQDRCMRGSYIATTCGFEIVKGLLMGYRMSCIEVNEDDCGMFRNMKESSIRELKELIKNSTDILIDKFNG